jgi:hypothetical protein
MATYLTSYYNIDGKKVGEKLVASDEHITDLFHAIQEFMIGTCGSNST